MYIELVGTPKVTPGSVAAEGICPGDLILKIGNVNATNITHNEAQEVITGASNILQLTIKKGSVVSSPVSSTSSAAKYSSIPPAHDQLSSPYEQHDKYKSLPDYKVGSGYHGYSNVNNSDGYNTYAQENSPSDPYNMRQFEQAPPISGYSTLPVKSSANKQNSESFRPVPQKNQNKYPYKSTTGIQLQINPQPQHVARDDYQRSYNSNPTYCESEPVSPVQYVNGDSPYQRQTSVGSNRSDTNGAYPQSFFKKPTPFSPTYNSQNGSTCTTPPPRLQRQTSQGSVHESTISQGFKPGTYLPGSDDAPPPPPPPTNYQPEPYRRPSYDQDTGMSPYQRQTSQPNSYNPSPYDQRQEDYNRYQNRQNQGMHVDTEDHPSPQHERQGSRPFEHDTTPPHYQRQPSNPSFYGERSDPGLQRQTSYGSQQQPPQQYGSPYTPPQSYERQQSQQQQQQQQFNRQSSRDQHQPTYNRQHSRDQYIEPPSFNPTSPPGTINSFDDILSPFENFQNSNYCDKLFARDNRGDGDSGVVSDLNSDTPRSNQSSNFSSYSPPQPYPGGYNGRGEVQQQQNLLRPAPQAPPPPPVTPPPPPPPPPPTDWAPTPKRTIPGLQEQHGSGESQMPDKVLNTMLKNQGTQKPFSYMPSGTDLKEFKERARQRRQPRPVMPRGYTGPAVDDDDTPAEPQRAQTSKPKPGAMPNPDSGMYKHAQYNSPLRMYTSDNAKEQFNIQSGGTVDVTGVNSTPDRRPSDIKDSEVYKMCQAADAKGKESHVSDHCVSEADTSRLPVSCDKGDVPLDAQSELEDRVFSPPPGAPRGQGLSFRVLQWLTDTADDEQSQSQSTESYKPKKPRDPLLRHNSEDDEMRFSGLHTKADIPSKAFQRLNKSAGSDNRTNVAAQGSGQDEENAEPQRIGNYDEASIRYRGNHIPSPSFRLLQTLAKEDDLRNKSGSPSVRTTTDDEDDDLPDKLNDEDLVDKRYTGANIPSKAFKALQMYMDDDKNTQSSDGEGSGPRIKVISRAKSPKVAPKPNDRPVNSPVPQPQTAPSTEF